MPYLMVIRPVYLHWGSLFIFDTQNHKMKKAILVVMLTVSLSTNAQAGIWDGIKEAARGVGWMFYMEACKLTWALFSEEGLNIGNLKYYCNHPQHDVLHKPNRK